MGNNAAFSSFEMVVHAIYANGTLTLPLLKKVAKAFADQDADSGGYGGQLTKGKDIYEIVAEVSGKKTPIKPRLPKNYIKWTHEQDRLNEEYQEAMYAIFDSVVKL